MVETEYKRLSEELDHLRDHSEKLKSRKILI
jgi:hypothetical protein